MKVGIFTFHEGLNHGAYLQAFATMRVLQELRHDVEIINYKNRRHWWKEDVRPWFAYRRPIRFVDRFRKERAFKRDQKLFNQTRFTKNPEDVRRLEFDAIVVGSDVVWDYKVFGFDDLFFGNLPARKKIAYAPSFGCVNFGDQHPAGVAERIKSFDAISVRDENSRRIVEAITQKSPPIVLDPTLIYDFNGDEKITPRIKKLGRYILVYCYMDDADVISRVRKYADRHGMKLVSVGYRQFWCDMTLMDAGPMEWLGLYHQASCVVTSTFHGTIFALKYEKEFFYIKNERAHNRIESLAEICGLKEAFFGLEDKVVLIQPDYKDVHRRLEPLVISSREWLRLAVGTAKIGL